MIFSPITPAVQTGIDAIALIVQVPLDAVSAPIQPLGKVGLTLRLRFFRQIIEAVVDSIAPGIEPVIDSIALGIEPVVDSIPSLIETVVEAVASGIKPAINAVAEPVEVTVCRE